MTLIARWVFRVPVLLASDMVPIACVGMVAAVVYVLVHV